MPSISKAAPSNKNDRDATSTVSDAVDMSRIPEYIWLDLVDEASLEGSLLPGIHRRVDSSEEAIVKAFNVLDRDKTGNLSRPQFTEGLNRCLITFNGNSLPSDLPALEALWRATSSSEDATGFVTQETFGAVLRRLKLELLLPPLVDHSLESSYARTGDGVGGAMAEASDGEHAASRAPPPLGPAGSKMTNQQHSMLGNLGLDESLLMKVFDFTRNQMYKRDLSEGNRFRNFFLGRQAPETLLNWITVESHDYINILRLAVKYRIHSLHLEDVLRLETQKPKMTLQGGNYFIVVSTLRLARETERALKAWLAENHDVVGVSTDRLGRRKRPFPIMLEESTGGIFSTAPPKNDNAVINIRTPWRAVNNKTGTRMSMRRTVSVLGGTTPSTPSTRVLRPLSERIQSGTRRKGAEHLSVPPPLSFRRMGSMIPVETQKSLGLLPPPQQAPERPSPQQGKTVQGSTSLDDRENERRPGATILHGKLDASQQDAMGMVQKVSFAKSTAMNGQGGVTDAPPQLSGHEESTWEDQVIDTSMPVEHPEEGGEEDVLFDHAATHDTSLPFAVDREDTFDIHVMLEVAEGMYHTRGTVEGNSAHWLLHSILDYNVDRLVPIVEAYQIRVSYFQDMLHQSGANFGKGRTKMVMDTKLDLLWLQRRVALSKPIIRQLIRIAPTELQLYYQDVDDHLERCLDGLSGLSNMAQSIIDEAHNHREERINEILLFITIITSIFTPASFLAGVFGMNFQTNQGDPSMPELSWEYGYLWFWLWSFILSGGVLACVRYKVGNRIKWC